MSDARDSAADLPDDMAEYLQTFLDETEEQLDDLTETMLALESDPTRQNDLNEAFRLIHSIKGSAGMMGFQSITELAHELENRFEEFRSGESDLTEATMGLVLRCIDFLRQCNSELRAGASLGDSGDLLAELRQSADQLDTGVLPNSSATNEAAADQSDVFMVVRFRSGLQLADLKAQLVLRRLADLGDVVSTKPPVEQLADVQSLSEFQIQIQTRMGTDDLRSAADVDGIESIEFADPAAATIVDSGIDLPVSTAVIDVAPTGQQELKESPSGSRSELGKTMAVDRLDQIEDRTTKKMGQTMRVDVDRLDNLMNLAGELVVNRARFEQVSGQVSPALRKASTLNRLRDFSESLRRTIESLENGITANDESGQIQQLRAGLELMDEQMDVLENGRRCVGQMSEAIDQLSRVSDSLQRVVLDTRMIAIGPLFNRFRRVVRDLSKEYGKQVELKIIGENTELDKRMIDELFDPLMHLVRNAIDHGLETAAVRVENGKPEKGTITLEASHNGNNVHIRVRDDGRGIDVDRIKEKLVERQILSEAAARELSGSQALDYIWHPGFSTSATVTDVSGRGVGMDVVKTRINVLNGNVEVDSTVHKGTDFTLRMPLTLAIINSLLVRLRRAAFSIPMGDVREIVVVDESDTIRVAGKRAFEIRGEIIPLVNIEDVFYWHGIDYACRSSPQPASENNNGGKLQVVILQTRTSTVGLQVDDLLGNQEIVVKSLSDNFVDIRGLSGASILGDGSVCLMLNTGTLIDMASGESPEYRMEGAGT